MLKRFKDQFNKFNLHLTLWPVSIAVSLIILILGFALKLYIILILGLFIFFLIILLWLLNVKYDINSSLLNQNKNSISNNNNIYSLHLNNTNTKELASINNKNTNDFNINEYIDNSKNDKNINKANNKLYQSLILGFKFFILTELILFLSMIIVHFYTKYLNPINLSSDNLSIESMQFLLSSKLDVLDLPLINTLILILSSFCLSWSYTNFTIVNNLVRSNSTQFKNVTYNKKSNLNYDELKILRIKNFLSGLILTIILGAIFLLLQIYEYYKVKLNNFNISSSVFYYITGFHAIHVLIGIIFLLIFYIQNINNKFNSVYLGFNILNIYWHFVDFVWILVFFTLYLFN